MKKVLMLFAALLLTLTASAQFEEGKKYADRYEELYNLFNSIISQNIQI